MASTSSISGLASGLDTESIITNLMAIEARPQTLLKRTLSDTQAKADAYRAANTRFDAIRAAAEALTSGSLQAARTASSTSTSVTASATAAAIPGSTVTFDVTSLATKHSLTLAQDFSSTTDPVTVPVFPIKVMSADGSTERATISVPPGASLLDVVTAVNSSSYGLNATVVQLSAGQYRLQIEAKDSGSEKAFSLADADGNPISTIEGTTGRDATLTLAGGQVATSPTNTFQLFTGTSVTVSKVETGVKVSVASDSSALTAKMSALVEAANGALGLIKGYTVSTPGAELARLQGDRGLISLADQVLGAVSSAVGGLGSAAQFGLQLTRDGKLAFDTGKFASALAADPAKVTAMIAGRAESTVDGVTTPAVTGVAQKLAAIATTASNSSTGTITLLAQGRDSLAKDLTNKIDNWTLRLEKRKSVLSAQFNALETALSALKTQSTWLSSQVNQLYNPNKQ
ncbi:flagellar filament capping protein FliD [Klenkia sp. LSe6-5]|uniref:Flagellar hook-associated protein 2 n=1 Tax=Klenkia sesuvii TaxID=3103137 RepID=A0ABU8DPE2_9ACTN